MLAETTSRLYCADNVSRRGEAARKNATEQSDRGAGVLNRQILP
jgi:hypothetical protein